MHVKISGNNYHQTFRKISINRGKVVFTQYISLQETFSNYRGMSDLHHHH